jgi:hypothetical protein
LASKEAGGGGGGGEIMESVKMRTAMATKREYRRMEAGEEGEELGEAEWAHRAEAQRQRRRRGQRYAFSCALFASLNAILLGYGQSICFFLLCVLLTASLPRSPPAKLPPFPFRFYPGPWGVERRRDDVHFSFFARWDPTNRSWNRMILLLLTCKPINPFE